jgi:hypothetical protein
LKSSSVVFGFGPSAVIVMNVALGKRSPTLIMVLPLFGVSLKSGR